MVKCPNCSREVSQGTIFCKVCGINIPLYLEKEKRYGKKINRNLEENMTNEEWFCGLDTEDKAREISDMTAQGYWSEELVERWLKEIHHD